MIKTIIFDIGNVLADYTGAHKKVIQEITIMASVRRGW